jgi:phytoene synthase
MPGFDEARKITRDFAKTFYLASLFLPEDKKYASYAVYAVCRLSDEAVDNSSGAEREENLRKLEAKMRGAYSGKQSADPLLEAFRLTVTRYKIPQEYFASLIEGMRMDLEIKRYADFPALYEYCYRAAGVVGLIMLKIFGCKDKAAEGYAVKLGVAMQLTNIMRDVKEDLSRGRVYLPQDEMAAFGVDEGLLRAGNAGAGMEALLRFQIERCRRIYEESAEGIKLIDGALCRFVVLCMKEIYAGILDDIERSGYDVFVRRACVSSMKKAGIILKIFLGRKYL